MNAHAMKARPGFTLIELLIAVTLLVVIGAAVTGLFVTQSKFFDQQQKMQAARNVTRSATNIIMSELRMLDRDSGVALASNTSITLRVPYRWGIYCGTGGGFSHLLAIPADSLMNAQATFRGFAYRRPDGRYHYIASATVPTAGVNGTCVGANVSVSSVPASTVLKVAATIGPTAGASVFFWTNIRYYFAASTAVPGRRGLYREVVGTSTNEELLAPFDTTAKFRFFVADADTAVDAAPSPLANLSGIELVLDAVSEKPNSDGSFTRVPNRTAVFFKNRRN